MKLSLEFFILIIIYHFNIQNFCILWQIERYLRVWFLKVGVTNRANQSSHVIHPFELNCTLLNFHLLMYSTALKNVRRSTSFLVNYPKKIHLDLAEIPKSCFTRGILKLGGWVFWFSQQKRNSVENNTCRISVKSRFHILG